MLLAMTAMMVVVALVVKVTVREALTEKYKTIQKEGKQIYLSDILTIRR